MKAHAELDIHIDPHTARTRWRGESMDYGIAIDVLLAQERRAREANASTNKLTDTIGRHERAGAIVALA